MSKNKKPTDFILKITPEELKNNRIKRIIVDLLDTRLYLQKSKPYFEVSPVEFEFISFLPRFVDRKLYAPKKSMLKFPGEVGKYQGKRLVVRDE